MNRNFTFYIDTENNNKAIDLFLKSHGFSRHILSRLKTNPLGILLNGAHATTRQLLSTGDVLSVSIIEEKPSQHIIPMAAPLTVCYEDQDILVVDKPADTPIHPSMNNYDNSLANAVAYYYRKESFPFVFRCINRLDRDTTGLTIIAKNSLSSAILSSMVKHREIHREYLAICAGIPPESGTIHAPIARKADSCIERVVDYEHGEQAITHYTRLAHTDTHSLIRLKLETGRTHQIRVHMKYLGYPLIGDYLYNPDTSRIKRQALHSHRLTFSHPITGEPLCFTSPLPDDMAAVIPYPKDL